MHVKTQLLRCQQIKAEALIATDGEIPTSPHRWVVAARGNIDSPNDIFPPVITGFSITPTKSSVLLKPANRDPKANPRPEPLEGMRRKFHRESIYMYRVVLRMPTFFTYFSDRESCRTLTMKGSIATSNCTIVMTRVSTARTTTRKPPYRNQRRPPTKVFLSLPSLLIPRSRS